MLPKPAPEGRTDTLQCLKLPKCWQLISNTNIYCKMYIHQLKGSTETLQLAYIYIPIVGWIYAIPTIYVFFDIYNIYICIRFEEYMSVEFIFWYWIRVTKCTFLTYTYICIEYMLPTFWGIHVSWRSSVHPSFGRRARECTFCNIYICIRYMRPTFGGYMSVGGFLCALWAQG